MRGKTKIGNSVLLLSLIVSSMLVAFNVAPASAAVASIRAPTIVNPLLKPGDTFTIDVIVDGIPLLTLYAYNFTLKYDTSLLEAKSFTVPRTSGGPNFPWTWSTSHIDTATGIVVIGANNDGKTTNAAPWYAPLLPRATVPMPLPVAFITFEVKGRGSCKLDLMNSALYKKDMTLILPRLEMDGTFDNRFQGILAAPLYKDEALEAGDEVAIEITIDDVKKLWGFQFTLSYDTNVLTVKAWYNETSGVWEPIWNHLDIFTELAPSAANDAEGWVRVAAHSYIHDQTGRDTTTPLVIARLYFTVDAEGWTALDLKDEVLADVEGNTLIVDVKDGSFASCSVVELAGTKLRVEHRNFHQASELALGEDLMNTIKTPIQTTPSVSYGAPVDFKVVFNVTDLASGSYLGTIESVIYTIGPHTTITVLKDFDTSEARWGTLPYRVYIEAEIQYDSNGDGIMDSIGGPIGPFDFAVLP